MEEGCQKAHTHTPPNGHQPLALLSFWGRREEVLSCSRSSPRSALWLSGANAASPSACALGTGPASLISARRPLSDWATASPLGVRGGGTWQETPRGRHSHLTLEARRGWVSRSSGAKRAVPSPVCPALHSPHVGPGDDAAWALIGCSTCCIVGKPCLARAGSFKSCHGRQGRPPDPVTLSLGCLSFALALLWKTSQWGSLLFWGFRCQ